MFGGGQRLRRDTGQLVVGKRVVLVALQGRRRPPTARSVCPKK